MSTIETIAQAIAETTGFDAERIAEVLTGQRNDGEEYFQELDALASNVETSVEVLEAIESYCSDQIDEEFAVDADDVHLLIRGEARATLGFKNAGACVEA